MTARRFRRAFLWGEYGSKDFRCTERRHRKTGRELHHSTESQTSLAWGAGVQFNPTESVAIDIAYEGSGSGDWRTDGFIVGVGYKF